MLKNLFKRIWKGVKNMAEKVIETVKKAADIKAEKELAEVTFKEKVYDDIRMDIHRFFEYSGSSKHLGKILILFGVALYLYGISVDKERGKRLTKLDI